MNLSGLFSGKEKDVVLFGIGRSGTTWLGQVIASAGLRYIFEPEAYWDYLPKEERSNHDVYPRSHRYLRADEETKYHKFLVDSLSGVYANDVTVRANPNASRNVIKVIRYNMIVPWVVKNMDVHSLFLLRDPMATISSQFSCDFETTVPLLTSYFDNEQLYEDHLDEFRDLIAAADSSKGRKKYIEYLTILWCVQMYVAKRQGVFEDVYTLAYRDLMNDPYKILWDISERFSLSFKFSELDKVLTKKSFTTHGDSKNKNHDPLTKWKSVFEGDEIKMITKIISQFGLESYIAES